MGRFNRRPYTDSQGVELRLGQKVAYNMSGTVTPGEIVRIGATGIIKILYGGKDTHLYVKTKFSKVQNCHTILVLREPSGSAPVPPEVGPAVKP